MAPAAVRLEEAPIQIVEGVAETVSVGIELTVIETESTPVQPFASVPVTE